MKFRKGIKRESRFCIARALACKPVFDRVRKLFNEAAREAFHPEINYPNKPDAKYRRELETQAYRKLRELDGWLPFLQIASLYTKFGEEAINKYGDRFDQVSLTEEGHVIYGASKLFFSKPSALNVSVNSFDSNGTLTTDHVGSQTIYIAGAKGTACLPSNIEMGIVNTTSLSSRPLDFSHRALSYQRQDHSVG